MQRWLVVFPTLLLLVASSAVASAQEATPASGLAVADPDLCQVEPRSIEDLASFIATPPPDYATPAPIDPPQGEPADAQTVAAVSATVTELYSCFTANDYLRAFSLFTDKAVARGFMEDAYTQETLDAFSTPTEPLPRDEWVSPTVEDITVRDDGRVGAIVVEHDTDATNDDFQIYLIFAEQDGRYLIDEFLQLEEE